MGLVADRRYSMMSAMEETMDIDRIEQFLERRTTSVTSLDLQKHIRHAHQLQAEAMRDYASALVRAVKRLLGRGRQRKATNAPLHAEESC